MNKQAVAKELVDIAKDLTARAPQMKKKWQDISIGEKFKYHRHRFVKITKTRAVDMRDLKPFRDSIVPEYEGV